MDTKHHLIVEHVVTTLGHDRTQLRAMARRTRDVVDGASLTVLADRGYFSGAQILACEQAGSKVDGRFDTRDFIYDPGSETSAGCG